MRNRNRIYRQVRLFIALSAVLLIAVAAFFIVRSFRHSGKEEPSAADAAAAAATAAAVSPADNSGAAGDAAHSAFEGGAAAEEVSSAGMTGAQEQAESTFPGDPSAASEGTAAEGAADADKPRETELEKGRAYLQSLDERTPEEVEALIEEARAAYEERKKRAVYEAARAKYREKLEGDQVWSYFDDYVFLGDSRVEGFNVFGFLPPDRILADPGDTITSITSRLDEVRALSPEKIFISYGINDVTVRLWTSPEDYVRDFSERIDRLAEAVPEAEIYINSILPVTEQAAEGTPLWAELPEYSEAVREMCAKKGITFIDNDALAEEHSDLYAMDGVHIQPDFYHYWAENQILGVYDKKHGY